MRTFCFFIVALFLISCSNGNQAPKEFIVSSIEDFVMITAQSNFKDTLFYEYQYRDSTTYSYELLSKKENQELKALVGNLKAEKTVSEFEIVPGCLNFAITSDEVKFYRYDFSSPKSNLGKLYYFFRLKPSRDRVNLKEIKKFWNIEGISAPENVKKLLDIR